MLVIVRLQHIGQQGLDVLRHLLEVPDIKLGVHALDVLENLLEIGLREVLFELSFGLIVN